ncbi:Zn-dependent oligopeptidase [Synechococcus sp. PCC 7502]|uniref:M3 family metallopeptidase n=1 Tax=Synechococcus sp. PCC 7502 TaxID=1173263 RepID=UPI00029FBF20|nr:M3 family metallopeptidase [Synechococcus sp. PCC 7502]AFY73915.1 Zn-dependent oligopeptidase [Synechococcus sp. PCC 7502]
MLNNPLLIGQGIPPFPEILPEHVVPAVTQLLPELELELESLENKLNGLEHPTWQDLVEPLDRLGDRLTWTWGAVGHLLSVKNSPELRTAQETMQPEVVKFFTRLSQSVPIYQAFKKLKSSSEWQNLEPAQHRIVESAIRDAELSGIGLTGADQEKFNTIAIALAELSTKFANNVLDATKAFSLVLTTPEELDGLPPSLLSLAAQSAGEEGKWKITLDYPSYVPFMQHSTRADLREQLYKAFLSRASSGDLDNQPIITKILELRQAKAKLLGFNSYAELSLASKMAPEVAAVEKLLEELRLPSYAAALQDLETLKEFSGKSELKPWDISFWAERYREAKFAYTDEELRPYFPLPQVLDGLFSLVKRLFGITVKPADGKAPVWHEDVRFFEIWDQDQHIASFYLDPYSRPAEKRGGAWMNDCIGRAKLGSEVRKPIAYLICNQTPPIKDQNQDQAEDQPSLMTFSEVETLFHEFGHGLQHMLTRVDFAAAAGINNVEWDAVELPSQFMENWCYDRPTLLDAKTGMARHYQTGEVLPEHYYQKLVSAKNYMTGSATLRQIHFSLIDIELHHRYDGTETLSDLRSRLAQTTMIIPPIPEDNFLCSFGHIFAGGYAAGYYSYKWAEVLSADAFAAFEDAGLDNEMAIAEIGKRYRDTVLALGGSKHPLEVFKAFRGREPITTPLLRHSGLVQAA